MLLNIAPHLNMNCTCAIEARSKFNNNFMFSLQRLLQYNNSKLNINSPATAVHCVCTECALPLAHSPITEFNWIVFVNFMCISFCTQTKRWNSLSQKFSCDISFQKVLRTKKKATMVFVQSAYKLINLCMFLRAVVVYWETTIHIPYVDTIRKEWTKQTKIVKKNKIK